MFWTQAAIAVICSATTYMNITCIEKKETEKEIKKALSRYGTQITHLIKNIF